jgi:agmatine deiminase
MTMPAKDGFWMPAEWEPHAGTWMLWPERPDNWRDNAAPAQRAFAAVAAAIVKSESVTMGVSADFFQSARAMLPCGVRVVEISSNDAWMRDVGPTFVVNRRRQVRGVDWIFNAWGGKAGGAYADWALDDQVAAKVLEIESKPRYRAPFILEGGAIDVDGQGTLLTTEECLLDPNRNPTLTRSKIESLLERHLGVQKIIWLGRGVFNDETDGHVDNLCCFVRPGDVVLTWCDNPEDPQYDISHAAYEVLVRARDARGRRLRIHKLMQPGPLYMTEAEAAGIERSEDCKPRRCGDRLAGSYVNFYIANRHIVMPLLDARTDRAAKATLAKLFPRRKVIGVPAREILLGGGNIHCITQQQPRDRKR